jgi:AGCS family alanine or glycine:cation symporter
LINEVLEKIGSFISGPYFLMPILVGTGIYMTFRLGWVQVRGFRHGLGLISGRYDDPKDAGEITHLQALSAALSGTIGIGNIAGVATAIHLGGPGAVFWMWVTAVFGMSLKFSSAALSLKYRVLHPDGSASGGPMYFIERGLGKKWKPLAVAFAICAATASLGIGNMTQSNTVAHNFHQFFHVPRIVTGLSLGFLVWLVIVGGIKRIGQVASRLVPAMCLLYILGGLIVLILRIGDIPACLAMIVRDAFSGTAATGGFVGVAVASTIRFGVDRGLFSNEAGLGSAPIAHAAAKTREPTREGLVAMLGPFIDTLVVCTMTALVIVSTGVWKNRFEGSCPLGELTILEAPPQPSLESDPPTLTAENAFTGDLALQEGQPLSQVVFLRERGALADVRLTKNSSVLTGNLRIRNGKAVSLNGEENLSDVKANGKMLLTAGPLTTQGFASGFFGRYANFFVTLAILLFAYSTMLTWSYYGDRSIGYLLGDTGGAVYRWVFAVFIVLGAVTQLNIVWNFSSIMNCLMAVPNLVALLSLSAVVAAEKRNYFSRLPGRQNSESSAP